MLTNEEILEEALKHANWQLRKLYPMPHSDYQITTNIHASFGCVQVMVLTGEFMLPDLTLQVYPPRAEYVRYREPTIVSRLRGPARSPMGAAGYEAHGIAMQISGRVLRFVEEAYSEAAKAAVMEADHERAEKLRKYDEDRKALLAQRQKEYEARLAKQEERREHALHDLIDEEVRVVMPGYREPVKATVEAQLVNGSDINGSNYLPRLRYHSERAVGRPSAVEQAVSVHVKRGTRYEEVWNDGSE